MSFSKSLKNITLIFLGIDPGFMKLYYRFFYKTKPNSIPEIIEKKAKQKKEFYFLQIGGNDGFVNDPIFKFVKRFSWKGIVVEPQKDVFTNRLSKTYRNEKNVILENVAIAEKSGVKKLYKIAFSNSRWATGLASFNRKSLENLIISNYVIDMAEKEGVEIPSKIKDCIVTEDVECSTMKDLINKHNVNHLDLLQVDTEGFDFEIIKTIDFSALKPSIIAYENLHLNESDFKKCEDLLSGHGYQITHKGSDSIACL